MLQLEKNNNFRPFHHDMKYCYNTGNANNPFTAYKYAQTNVYSIRDEYRNFQRERKHLISVIHHAIWKALREHKPANSEHQPIRQNCYCLHLM